MTRCAHKTARNHWPRGLQSWPQVWICSVCKREFEWNSGSSYWGNIECKQCMTAHMDWVACSESCAAKRLPAKAREVLG